MISSQEMLSDLRDEILRTRQANRDYQSWSKRIDAYAKSFQPITTVQLQSFIPFDEGYEKGLKPSALKALRDGIGRPLTALATEAWVFCDGAKDADRVNDLVARVQLEFCRAQLSNNLWFEQMITNGEVRAELMLRSVDLLTFDWHDASEIMRSPPVPRTLRDSEASGLYEWVHGLPADTREIAPIDQWMAAAALSWIDFAASTDDLDSRTRLLCMAGDSLRHAGFEQGWCSHGDAALEADSTMARKGAHARHMENRAMKAEAISHYLANAHLYGTKDAAAEAMAGKIVPVKFRTVRDWLSQLRSTGTP